eukprot:4431050-Amphidinium_carterae.1
MVPRLAVARPLCDRLGPIFLGAWVAFQHRVSCCTFEDALPRPGTGALLAAPWSCLEDACASTFSPQCNTCQNHTTSPQRKMCSGTLLANKTPVGRLRELQRTKPAVGVITPAQLAVTKLQIYPTDTACTLTQRDSIIKTKRRPRVKLCSGLSNENHYQRETNCGCSPPSRREMMSELLGKTEGSLIAAHFCAMHPLLRKLCLIATNLYDLCGLVDSM